jgi:hypothetical protein
MADSNVTTEPARPKQRSVLLGLFIVAQLAFLVVSNLFNLLKEAQADVPADAGRVIEQAAPGWLNKQGHVWNFMEGAMQLTNRWSQVTLQLQQWSLFAPSIGKECVFPALLLSDDEPPAAPIQSTESPANYETRGRIVLSDNEPVDMQRYFRWGKFRLRKYENNLVLYLRPEENEEPKAAEERRDRVKQYVTENTEMLTGYLRFRLNQRAEPQPRQVILLMRCYTLSGPEAGTDFLKGPFTIPVARWLPSAATNSLEFFNPVTQRFEPLQP